MKNYVNSVENFLIRINKKIGIYRTWNDEYRKSLIKMINKKFDMLKKKRIKSKLCI